MANEDSAFYLMGVMLGQSVNARVKSADLASTDAGKGAELVGYKAPMAGAVSVTQAQLNSLRPVPIELFGGVGDGVTDNAAAFQAAFDAGVTRLTLGAGRYRIDSDVVGSGNITIEGSGPDTVLDFYNGTGQLRIEGSYTALPAPSGHVSTNQAWINFASAPDLQSGDVFFLYDPTDYSWNGARSYYRKGEFLQVHSISGNRANIFGGTSDSYVNGTFDMYKVNPVCLNLSNLTIIESNTPSKAAVKVVFGVGVRISNVFGLSSQYTAIELERCYDFAISDVSVLNYSPEVGDEYGITLSNCQKGYVRGGGTGATRHTIAIGGSDVVGGVPCRYILISDMVLDNFNTLPADGGGGVSAGDLHSNSEFITYDNCVFKNGAPLSGANNTVRNSTIFSMRFHASGNAVYASEIVRGINTIENCVIYAEGDGSTGDQGFITLRGGSALMDSAVVVIRNVTIRSYGSGLSGTTADMINLMINTDTTSHYIDVIVDGLQLVLGGVTFRSVLRPRSVDGVTPLNSRMFCVDNVVVSGSTGSAYLIYPHATMSSVPTKEMRQSGSVVVSTTTSSPIAVPVYQPFKLRYSKIPNVQVAVSTPTGAAGSFVGSDAPVPRVYELSYEGIRPAAITPDSTNFTAATDLRLHWSAEIS